MKGKKKFDCVQMKRDIQRKIMEEFAGMPEKEARRIQDERVRKDPILGPLVRRLTKKQKHA